MDSGVLEAAATVAAFDALQAAFNTTPPEYAAQIAEQHQALAEAIAAAVIETITHIQTFAQATGTVATVVATTGTAAAQTGTGTGTATVAPGGIT